MKSFKQHVCDGAAADAGNIFVFEASDKIAEKVAAFLCEGGKSYDLSKGYHCRFDRAHVTGQQDHLHVYLKQNQACVINRDGTPSHSTTIDLPGYVRDAIKALGLVTLEEGTEYLLGPSLDLEIGAASLAALIREAEEQLAGADG
jgi:hypothetical protein